MVIYSGSDRPVRYSHNVELTVNGENKTRAYVPLPRILENPELRSQLIALAKAAFDVYQAKYEALSKNNLLSCVLFSSVESV